MFALICVLVFKIQPSDTFSFPEILGVTFIEKDPEINLKTGDDSSRLG